jgi:chitodextrinase
MRITSTLFTMLVTASVAAQASPPQVTPFGVGCPGYGGRAPSLSTVGLPSVCNSSFALRVAAARPASATVFALATGETVYSFGPGCEWYLLGLFATGTRTTDAAGVAQIPLPIDADPSQVGRRFVAQAFALDPQGGIVGFAGSNGLRLTVGMLPPAAPSGVRIDNLWSRRLDLRWNDNSCDEAGFAIDQTSNGTQFVEVRRTVADDVVERIEDLLPNTRYGFRVRAFNAAGSSAPSELFWVTTRNEAPAAPSGLRVVSVQPRSVNIAWNDNSNNELEFRVAISRDGVAFDHALSTAPNQTSGTISGLLPNTRYWFKVRAANEIGLSDYSSTITVTTPNQAPAAPTGLYVKNLWSTRLDLGWRDNSDNETEFRIAQSRDGVNYNNIGVTDANVVCLRVQGLLPNTLYWFKVRAANAAGFSAYSEVLQVRTRP